METQDRAGQLDPEVTERMLTRREALLGGGRVTKLAAGLAMGSPLALAALATDAFAQGGLPDKVVDVLNFGLVLEDMAIGFYTRALQTQGLLTGDVRPVIEQFLKHETGHARFIRQTLGERARPTPRFDYTGGMGRGNGPFADVFSSLRTFTELSQGLEDMGVRALKGQAPYLLRNDAVLQSALRIHSVEARHASKIRRIRQQKGWIPFESPGGVRPPQSAAYEDEDNTFHFILAPLGKSEETTRAFDEPLTRTQTMAILRPFIAGGADGVGGDE